LETIALGFNHQLTQHLAAVVILSFQQQWVMAAGGSRQQQAAPKTGSFLELFQQQSLQFFFFDYS
jgi:hypothetical protein